MHLQRVVVEGGRPIGAVDGDGRGAERTVDVALLRVRREVRVDLRRRVETGVVLEQNHAVRVDGVLHAERTLRLLGRGIRVGDDSRDPLVAVGDAARLEERELRILEVTELRGVPVPEHGEHTGQLERLVDRDVAHLALRDRRADADRVRDILGVVFVGVPRLAGDLLATFDPVDRRAENPLQRGAHRQTSSSSEQIVLRAILTL